MGLCQIKFQLEHLRMPPFAGTPFGYNPSLTLASFFSTPGLAPAVNFAPRDLPSVFLSRSQFSPWHRLMVFAVVGTNPSGSFP